MNAEIETFCDRVLAALVNGGYQGLLLAALICACLKFAGRTNATTRHAIGLLTLVFVALLPVAHLLLPQTDWPSFTKIAEPAIPEASVSVRQSVAVTEPSNDSEFTDQTIDQPRIVANESNESSDSSRGLLVSKESAIMLPQKSTAKPIFLSNDISEPLISGSSVSSLFSTPGAWWHFPIPGMVRTGLVCLWAICAAARIANLGWQYWLLRRLKGRGTPLTGSLRELSDRLQGGAGMKRHPAIVICAEPIVPMVAGFLHPAILLPQSVVNEATEPQIEQILRHELAHVARADDWANLLQQIVKGLFFFHPAVWWLSKRLTIEREIACDDHVLSAASGPQAYALFLTEFARRTRSRDWVAAPAAWSKRSQLTERINMILDSKRNASPHLARTKTGLLTIAAVLLAAWGLRAGPRIALAAEKPEAVEKSEATERSEDKTAQVEVNKETKTITSVNTDSGITSKVSITPGSSKVVSIVNTDSGPRSKPGALPVPISEPNVLILTRDSISSSPRLASIEPVPPVAPAVLPASPAPHPDRKPRDHGDESLERRLDRLERMVEKLAAREKDKGSTAFGSSSAAVLMKPDGPRDFIFNYKAPDFQWSDKWKSGVPSEEDLAKFKEMAKHQAEIAAKQVDRAVREMEKARQDSIRAEHDVKHLAEMHAQNGQSAALNQDVAESQRRALEKQQDAKLLAEMHAQNQGQPSVSNRDGFDGQRRQLEAQRRALEKQMHALEKQINRLEEEQQKAQQHQDEHQKRNNRLDRDGGSSTDEASSGESGPKHKAKADSGSDNQ